MQPVETPSLLLRMNAHLDFLKTVAMVLLFSKVLSLNGSAQLSREVNSRQRYIAISAWRKV